MMKIMHVGQLIGGLDIYIRNSIAYSNHSDIEFVILHGKDDNSKPMFCGDKQVREHLIDLYRSLNPFKDLKCLWQVIRLIKAEKPDLIHCHSAKGGFIGRIAGWCTGVKTLYTPHAFSFLSSSLRLKGNIYLTLERIAKLNSYLLACSESERQLGMEIVRYKDSHALVWHNSVPDASVHHGMIEIPDGQRFITYIGRPCYQKNPFFLLDVIRKVGKIDNSLKFYLLGVGYHSPDLDQMKRKIEEYGIGDSIVLMPWLNHEDCLEYVRNSLFYLTCSLYEGLPLSVIEAMSLGKAVIASDVVGNRNCVKDLLNGFLLPLDENAFANRIVELSSDEKMRIAFERESCKLFKKYFFLDTQIEKLHAIYKSLVTK